MTGSNKLPPYQEDIKPEKESSVSESHEEGTVIETITTHEVFVGGDGHYGEGSADEVNVRGNYCAINLLSLSLLQDQSSKLFFLSLNYRCRT